MVRSIRALAVVAFTLLPVAATAQSDNPPRLGLLGGQAGPEDESFFSGLRDLGWIKGQNLSIEERWSRGKNDLLPGLATELAQLGVKVIVVGSSRYIDVVRQAAPSTPIVFCSHGDPVGAGHVASLERPGGNITGIASLQTAIVTGMFELLTQAVPSAKRISVLYDPRTPSNPPAIPPLQEAARRSGVELQAVTASVPEELDTAMAKIAADQAEAVLVQPAPNAYNNRGRIADLGLRYKLPTVLSYREQVVAGGLMSNGPDLPDMFRRCASAADKVLKGTNPAEVPVEQAAKYRVVVNLNTARALGLEITQVLARADEVIK
jgi:putative ABC transport system substrate-binding protein